MFNTAMHSEFLHDHADYGFTVSDVKFNWGYVLAFQQGSNYYRVLWILCYMYIQCNMVAFLVDSCVMYCCS